MPTENEIRAASSSLQVALNALDYRMALVRIDWRLDMLGIMLDALCDELPDNPRIKSAYNQLITVWEAVPDDARLQVLPERKS